MQGEEAEQSIITALDNIYKYEDFFDVVIIIRGGGAQSDLDCFNNYWLAYHITQFPIPVLTGIGHEQDESVVDIVAHTQLKTPTAVAEFLLSKFRNAENCINELENKIVNICTDIINREKRRISRYLLVLTPTVTKTISESINKLNVIQYNILAGAQKMMSNRIQILDLLIQRMKSLSKEYIIKKSQSFIFINKRFNNSFKNYFSNKNYKLSILGKRSHYLDPKNVLKLGYSITYHNNKNIKSSSELDNEDIIETVLYKGKINSKVVK